jgi:hypothetical protein
MNFTVEDIKAIGEPLAARMLPGWTINWILCKSDDIGGALAMVFPTPKRQIATIKIAPHPPGESIAESIAHELTHAVLSPLTGLIEYSEAAVMVEEPIAERLGKLLAQLPTGLARAVSNALKRPRTTSQRIRARISVIATSQRKRGNNMVSKDTIMNALEALKSGDAAAATDVLAAILAEMVGGGEPDGDEQPAAGKDPQQDPVAEQQPMGKDPMAYRKPIVDARARAALSEIEMIQKDARQEAKERLVVKLRESLPEDHSGLSAIEKKIMNAKDYATAKDYAELVLATGGGSSRSNSGTKAGTAKTRESAQRGASDDEMKALGCSAEWIKNYREEYAKDPKGAEAMLDGVRARQTSNVNPWKGGSK